jgi:uncharacterized protein (TIGR00255 family)
MTGFGEGRSQSERLSIVVEVKAVNNRYLKVLTKCSEKYVSLEQEIERVVRGMVSRGTISVNVRADSIGGPGQYSLNGEMLRQYWKQLSEMAGALHVAAPPNLGALLSLPGVVSEEAGARGDCETDWPQMETALREALSMLQEFRTVEGKKMEQELRANCTVITEQLKKIADQAPQVVREYRDKMRQRVSELLAGAEAEVADSDLIREVSVFADRCDINEEITRLRSHLEQFDAFLREKESQGRKLEFLGQEMFREVNTIGSKANSVAIAHNVVEMKAAIEKMREILQNVE